MLLKIVIPNTDLESSASFQTLMIIDVDQLINNWLFWSRNFGWLLNLDWLVDSNNASLIDCRILYASRLISKIWKNLNAAAC